MTIYIDTDFKCHTQPAEGLRAFDVPSFDGKCPAYIKGTRYVPQGEKWIRSDGEEFIGEMISPCIDSRIRDAYQEQYEEMLAEIAEREAALAIMGVTVDE